MRTFYVLAAAAVAATALIPQTASAQRVCRQECVGIVCQERCIETEGRGERRDGIELRREGREFREERSERRGPGLELRVPGVEIELGPRR